MTAGEQARVFLAMMLCGAALGAAYDAALLLRCALGLGRCAQGGLDLLFGVTGAFFVTEAALRLRVSPFRIFILAGVGAGIGVYTAAIGMNVRKMCRKIQKSVKKSKKSGEKSQGDAGKRKKKTNVSKKIEYIDAGEKSVEQEKKADQAVPRAGCGTDAAGGTDGHSTAG